MLTITELNNKLNKQGYELNENCIKRKSISMYILSVKTGDIHGSIVMELDGAGTYKFDRKNKKVHELLTEFCKQVKEFYDNTEEKFLYTLKEEYLQEGLKYCEENEEEGYFQDCLYLDDETFYLGYKAKYHNCYSETDLKEKGFNIDKINKYFDKQESWFMDKKIYEVLN